MVSHAGLSVPQGNSDSKVNAFVEAAGAGQLDGVTEAVVGKLDVNSMSSTSGCTAFTRCRPSS
jgi:hypothetical protein